VLHSGFDWLTEAFDTLPDVTKTQAVSLEIMKNWKSEISNQSKDIKRMYAKIDEILKVKLLPRVSNELEKAKTSQDVVMIEEGKDHYAEACSSIHKTC
jgi:low affinity Fe/Cu permease